MSTSIGFSFWAKEKTEAIKIIAKVIEDNNVYDRVIPRFYDNDPDEYSGGWVFENGDTPGAEDSWHGPDFNMPRIEKNELKLWIDCGKSNAIWQIGNKRYRYNIPLFNKIIKALDGVDCSDTYMLTSCDGSGRIQRTYGSYIRKEWKGKLA